MKRRCGIPQVMLLLFLFLLCLPRQSVASTAGLPVFTVKYDGSVGTEEDEEEGDLIPSSMRNGVSLKVKEEFTKQLKADIQFTLVQKDYFEGTGGYTWYSLKQKSYLDIRERWDLDLGLKSKWMSYQAPDASGFSKDYLALRPDVALAFTPVKGTKLTSTFKAAFDLYENSAKTRQAYTMSLKVSSRVADCYTLSGHYKGTIRAPLGDESSIARNQLNTFGLSVSYDANKKGD